MRIHLRLFAVARDLAGVGETDLELPDSATVADLRTAIARRWPALASLAARVMVAVNSQYASDSTRLDADSEVALIPPVSGG